MSTSRKSAGSPDGSVSSSKKPLGAGAWAFGAATGLREDGGWVDVLKSELSGCDADLRATWEELVLLARDARPRSGDVWSEIQQKSESQCGYPPSGYPETEPHPEPGTEAYQEALARSAPDSSWLDRVGHLARQLGEARFSSTCARLYRSAVQSGIGSLNRPAPNREILRALIWFVAAIPHPEMVDALRQLAIWSIEHNTAQANTIGIALAFTATEQSAAALRMIETAAKRPSPRTRFGRFGSHVERKTGINPDDSAERFVPDFGLDQRGLLVKRLGDHGAAEVCLAGSKALVRFYNAAGKALTTVPAAIRRDHAGELQEVRLAAKGLDQLLKTQRSRIEAMLVAPRRWDFSTWKDRYLEHPVVGALARRLIWTLDHVPVLFVEGTATDAQGGTIPCRSSAEVRLWHPLQGRPEEVVAWRTRLETLGITQPFKQAHREVYLLTEAERRTATYSNRFAGHILRQAQFRSLALERRWQAPFLGGWDGGDEGEATRDLPDHWRVEFWVQAFGDQSGQTGGLLHVATDQVRFYHGSQGDPSPLEDVPALTFSEALRDVDLFVSVCSLGNDPSWADGGPDRPREYWRQWSFGELNATAATRHEILGRLLPKLKIAGQCSLSERFLVVRGRLRSYKIHLGSGNILMEPNDQFLCIVPDRKSDATQAASKVFLPFEGDHTLSVVLSKAFLLAEDDRIKDKTIIRQIRAR